MILKRNHLKVSIQDMHCEWTMHGGSVILHVRAIAIFNRDLFEKATRSINLVLFYLHRKRVQNFK